MPHLFLELHNFRNIVDGNINLNANEVFFVGDNAQGKSNLLEALYIVSYGNSFRTRQDSTIVKTGFESFSVKTLYNASNDRGESIGIYYENGKKRIEKFGKKVKDRKNLINAIPTVLFCHDDMLFVTGEPVYRRFFLDQCLCMFDIVYLDIMRTYRNVLKSRNIALKDRDTSLIQALDLQLVEAGLTMQKKRSDLVFLFNQIFCDLYEKATGQEGVKLVYAPSWHIEPNATFEEKKTRALQMIQNHFEQELILKTTLTGPHRDRLNYIQGVNDFVQKASTGQRRSLALVLRVAQAKFYKEICQKDPVLLMDDVLLELDGKKRENFTFLLPKYDQLFCTFLTGEPYEKYKKKNTLVYKIQDGSYTKTL